MADLPLPVTFDFVATNPAFLDLQADPSTIGVNVPQVHRLNKVQCHCCC